MDRRSTAKKLEVRKKRKRALELRTKGWSFADIADEMGISTAFAWNLVNRALKEVTEEPAKVVVKQEVLRLDALYRKTYEVLEGVHYAVNSGEVVHYNGEPLTDVGPLLQAVDKLLKVQARRATLLGLDKPTKHSMTNPDGDEERPVGLQVTFVAPTPGQALASPPDEQESS